MIRRMINHAVDKRVDEIIEKFCPHSEWKTIASVYNPRGPLARTRNIDEYTLELLIFGFTMITQRCAQCGKITTTRHLGQVHVPGLTPAER